MVLGVAHWVVPCFTLHPLGWLGLGHLGVESTPSSRDVVSSHSGQEWRPTDSLVVEMMMPLSLELTACHLDAER